MEKEQFLLKLDQYFNKLDPKKQPLSVEVQAFKDDVSFIFNKDEKQKLFHTFGLSKLFMLVLVLKQVELKKLDLDQPIINYIDPALLNNLFIYRDHDYQSEVTLRQLLNHTSGVADYFEGANHKEQKIVDLMIKDPGHLFTAYELLDFTKTNQSAVGIPGQRFYYSDTGYVLISLILEDVTQKTYQELLKTYITKPLNLKNTYVYARENRNEDLADVLFNGVNIRDYLSLTCHWVGGGIVSNTNDLITFLRALVEQKLVSQSILDKDICCEFPFIKGMTYGLGVMEVNLEKMPFLYKTKKLPPLRGHMSFYGTHLWVDIENDLYIALNYGTNRQFEKGFKILTFISNAYHSE
jgi:D-alanyl-D-alanine carboxypeptidase